MNSDLDVYGKDKGVKKPLRLPPNIDTINRLSRPKHEVSPVRHPIPLSQAQTPSSPEALINIEKGELREFFVSTNNENESNTERSTALEYLQKR